MAYKDNSILTRFKFRRPQSAITAPEPEWRENMRDLGLMLSGVYQDLRGDARETWGHFSRWLAAGVRKFFSRPN